MKDANTTVHRQQYLASQAEVDGYEPVSWIDEVNVSLNGIARPLGAPCANCRCSKDTMKFGLTLAESLVPEWREYYIDYESLKHKLKQVRL